MGPDKNGNVALHKKEVLSRASLLMRMIRDKYEHTFLWHEFNAYMHKEEVSIEEFNRGFLPVFAKYGFKEELEEPDMDVLKEFIMEVKKVVSYRSMVVIPAESMLQ